METVTLASLRRSWIPGVTPLSLGSSARRGERHLSPRLRVPASPRPPLPAAVRTLRPVLSGLLATVLAVAAGCGPRTEPRFDRGDIEALGPAGPVFEVNAVLSAQVIRGPNYEIEPRVQVFGDEFLFRIRTAYGILPAHGLEMLELRLREMHSIRVAEDLRRRGHFSAGVIDNLRKTGRGLEELLADPAGALLRAPKGLGRMVQQGLDASDRRAGSLTRRQIAAYLQCDPETSNPVLKAMLDDMALRQAAGGLMAGAALGAMLPGMGLLSTTTDIKQTVTSTPPHEINARIENELARLGIDADLRERFCRDVNYTTTQRLIFMQYFRTLQRVAGFSTLIEAAVAAETEAQGLSIIHETMLWARLHLRRPLERFVRDAGGSGSHPGLIAAELQDGSLMLVTTADYLADPEPFCSAAADFRRDHPDAPVLFCGTAYLSPQASQRLGAADIRIMDRSGI